MIENIDTYSKPWKIKEYSTCNLLVNNNLCLRLIVEIVKLIDWTVVATEYIKYKIERRIGKTCRKNM